MKPIFINIIKLIFHYGRSFLIIFVCLWAGNAMSTILPVMIPGSVLGLLLLFFLLIFQIIKPDWLKCGCNLLMRYMTLLFIPAGMGIMDTYPYLFTDFAPLFWGTIGSSVIVLLYVGYMTQYLHADTIKGRK